MKRHASLRYRLLSLVLIPLVLLSVTLLVLAYQWSSHYTDEQLFAKVNTDLRVARNSFSGIEADGQRRLFALANSVQLADALSDQDVRRLSALIESETRLAPFDYLNVLSGNARQFLMDETWQPYPQFASSLIDEVVGTHAMVTVSGIEIFSAQRWQQQSGLEASAIELPLLDTPRAVPTTRESEDRAMLLRTLQSVYDAGGNRVAILESGLLLNRNFVFVDSIRDLVYGPGSVAPGSRGTVTVFLDDVRIATNVLLDDNTRALGTRVSQEVRDAVLTRGETWVDRAFVVNDWYISAYEPIVDVSGERVGMLYAGYLESPYRAEQLKAIAALSGLVLAGSLAAAIAATIGARSIFAPIETITAVVRATARGEHQRIGPLPTGNEIGELAFQFDAMMDKLDSHRQRIERDALLLEEKVQQRTLELEQQNRRLQESINLLQQTRLQLATAEKLAALGELTAGVAHEINNPTAVILGNMEVLIADLGNRRAEVQTEIDLIIKQVYRIRSITDRLLQYSRAAHLRHGAEQAPFEHKSRLFSDGKPVHPLLPEAEVSTVPPVELGKLIDETLFLMSHELDGTGIAVHKDHQANGAALIDRQECQQVLINLLSNAIHSISSDGLITVKTCDVDSKQIVFSVRDTGKGIRPEHLPRLFDPFFTEGKVQGTGLGLSVSYGIVRRHGGDIVVSSESGGGSCFTVSLPAARWQVS